ncbi:diguanylate cyclase (GGDEF) domain-containing protein [Andreprevotia lacus DSM 23236]|jgi:diguanylate cyclase (GGDEF)-like protein|uniref:diguanylate cyclase n=1 Tax=Andreprevotia lacus DSM 23236 TaxID=1121001 RepID=A0A1W1XMI4_9NEIS|nr:GGDEF domain-containing protein [Andreprevotia lacus]SMC25055.1 diguanylate cyclase (GGDEF) domain-containing protein [Andreprevotia lacus DSM 23236]
MPLNQLYARLDTEARTVQQEAEQLARTARDAGQVKERLEAELLVAIAIGRQGRFGAALAALDPIIKQARAAKLDQVVLIALDEGGGHALQQAEAMRALNYWGDCLQLALLRHDARHAIRALVGLGKAFFSINDYSTAKRYHYRALELAQPSQSPASLAQIYVCLAADLLHLNDPTTAEVVLRVGEEHVMRHDSRHWQIEYLLHLGTALLQSGDVVASEQYLQRAEEAALVLGYGWAAAQAALQRGELDMQRGESDACLTHFSRAIAHAEQIDSQLLLERIHQAAYRCYKQMDRPRQALDHLKAFHRCYEANQAKSDRYRISVLGLRRLKQMDARLELALREYESVFLEGALRQEQAARHALLTEAQTDALTRLGNRRALEQSLDEQEQLQQTPYAIILLDLDHFKHVNDLHGHRMGDLVLQTLAQLLRECCRQDPERIARYGGEEFCLLLPGASRQAANAIAERIHKRVHRHDWHAIAPALQVTVSQGVAAAEHYIPPRQLLDWADHALYSAKHGGRDRIHTFQATALD